MTRSLGQGRLISLSAAAAARPDRWSWYSFRPPTRARILLISCCAVTITWRPGLPWRLPTLLPLTRQAQSWKQRQRALRQAPPSRRYRGDETPPPTPDGCHMRDRAAGSPAPRRPRCNPPLPCPTDPLSHTGPTGGIPRPAAVRPVADRTRPPDLVQHPLPARRNSVYRAVPIPCRPLSDVLVSPADLHESAPMPNVLALYYSCCFTLGV